MATKTCICPICGVVHDGTAWRHEIETKWAAYWARLCDLCGSLSPVDRDMLHTIRVRRDMGRELTRKQWAWIKRNPQYSEYVQ